MGISITHPINKYQGVITGIKNNEMEIRLPRGKKVLVPKKNMRIGQVVCLLLDALEKHIIDTITLQEAEDAAQCGSNPAFEGNNNQFIKDAIPTFAEELEYGEWESSICEEL
jgi:hypothetical protein